MILKYFLFSLLFSLSLFGKSNFGAIITGSKSGTYIQFGQEISDVFKKYDANLEVIPSNGSLENLDALMGKNDKLRAKWAIVQNDALECYNLIHAQKTNKDIKNSIKTILPLYNEHIHVFSKKGKAISFKQGTTLRVGVSSKTSGSNITAMIIEKAYGVTFKYKYINYKMGMKYLHENKLDIYIDVLSLPNKRYPNLKSFELIQLPKNTKMDTKYTKATFSNKHYKWIKKDVSGYKVPSVLITNRLDKKFNQTVGIFVKIIINNYNKLIKNGHPKWQEAYKNRFTTIKNMHPEAYKILHK